MTAEVAPSRVTCADGVEWLASLSPASVDLIYIDPPFNTGRTQQGRSGTYDDAWDSADAYLAFVRGLAASAHAALKPTGSMLLHVDWRTMHHCRLVLDDVFGADRFVNHLVWSYGLGGSSPRRFARKHDDILFYGRTDEYWFDPPRVPATSRRMQGEMKKATDVLDIPAVNNMAHERTGYPTQKPLALLTLLVKACCPAGGLVADPCCGSGTTLAAALTSGRRALGADSNPEAVALTRGRLASIAGEENALPRDAEGRG